MGALAQGLVDACNDTRTARAVIVLILIRHFLAPKSSFGYNVNLVKRKNSAYKLRKKIVARMSKLILNYLRNCRVPQRLR